MGIPRFLGVQTIVPAQFRQAEELRIISLGKETAQQEIEGHEDCGEFHANALFVCLG